MNTIVTWHFLANNATLFLNVYEDGKYVEFINLYTNISSIPELSSEEYKKCLEEDGGTILHYTTASTYEEVRQQYPELFI